MPTRKAVERWAEQAPAGFQFAVKASRNLTHIRRLRDMETGLARSWRSRRQVFVYLNNDWQGFAPRNAL